MTTQGNYFVLSAKHRKKKILLNRCRNRLCIRPYGLRTGCVRPQMMWCDIMRIVCLKRRADIRYAWAVHKL